MPDATAITMNVSLPEPLKRYIDAKVASGIYGSASEFVREAIRDKYLKEQERARAESILAGKLLEGLDSGKPIAFTDEYTDAKKAAFRERLRSGKKKS